ncbi:hypothetical protein GIB67_025276 [Kingdonia uniflora]|uniref:BHLH domain-containing protein n=1 Tax=Kingdonia uniflora TaxID=39325 RepID=A0A7J7NBQ6_9MAGN|nr:hypothetical protein GIB67_025276 [Kingdonia uniflora]
MNRGVLQSLPVQQLMAGNPNWWSINSNMRPPHPHEQLSSLLPSPSSIFPHQFTPSTSSLPESWGQDLPESWSQLLMGGLVGEDQQRSGLSHWEDQVVYGSQGDSNIADVKEEVISEGGYYVYRHENEEFQATRSNWSQVMPVSSPNSCITSFSSNNMLDFSNNKRDVRHHHQDQSSECNSTATGGAFKKARIQPSPPQTVFKVRKEKVSDRITALHQLVSPFGKTDTASVLLEAIGYIRFLQSQIEALCTPYMGSSGSGNMRQQQPVQGERSCKFPEDPGQLLNETGMKRRLHPQQEAEIEPKKDLRSRGLCLVPVSCTTQVGSDNGADYWAPTLGGGFR